MIIKERIKKYFTAKPKSDFWMWAFITLFLFRWFAPIVLLLMIPFQIGLLSPTTQVDYETISANVADNIVKPMIRINQIGMDIALESPLIAKIIASLYGYLTWIIWIAMITLLLNLFRYGTYYLFKKVKKRSKERSK